VSDHFRCTNKRWGEHYTEHEIRDRDIITSARECKGLSTWAENACETWCNLEPCILMHENLLTQAKNDLLFRPTCGLPLNLSLCVQCTHAHSTTSPRMSATRIASKPLNLMRTIDSVFSAQRRQGVWLGAWHVHVCGWGVGYACTLRGSTTQV
jgi:hypothetical protein